MGSVKNQSVKKHVGAIHVSGKLSLLKRKIANVLLLNAYEELTTASEHSIKIQDLADVAGFNSKDIGQLKNAFRDLAKTTVEWNVLSEEGGDEWTVSTLLSRATIKKNKGLCSYAYDTELSKKLHHPEMYARINLAIQREFRSSYALALYENCVRFRKVKTTGWITLANWRKLFGVDDKEYLEFKDFSKRVLKPAISEINEKSDIFLGVEYRRESRKVNQIRFLISEQADDQTLLSAVIDCDAELSVGERMVLLGINKKTAGKLLLEFESSQIERNLDYVESELKTGKVIANVGGYAVNAIQLDYGLGSSERTKRDAQLRQQAEGLSRALIMEERRTAEEQQIIALKLEQEFEALDETTKFELVRQTILNASDNEFLSTEYNKKGLDSVFVFQSVLAEFKKIKSFTT